MMIKAIFFDIDGTLVSFKTHKIPESTIQALHTLKAKGIKLFIATGRPPYDLKFLIDEFGDLFSGYITFNGQYCYDSTGKILHEEYLNREDLIQFINYIKDKDIACGFMEIDYFYFNLYNDRLAKLKETLGDTAPDRAFDDVSRVSNHKTYQLNIFLNEDEEQEVLPYLPNCKAVRWCPYFTDIIPKDGGKGTGIKKVLAHYGIDINEAMAFGDGGNDVEMLEAVKYGIAMGNANDNLKQIADFITLDVDNDGVAYALKQYNVL